MTPGATGTAEFGLSASGNAALSIGGKQVVSYGPGTGSTFTGLTSLTAGKAVSFELDATGLSASGGGGSAARASVVSLTWAPQENLLWEAAASAAKSSSVAVVFASDFQRKAATCRPWNCRATRTSFIEAVAHGQPAHDRGAEHRRPSLHAVAERRSGRVRGLVPGPAGRQRHRRAPVRGRNPSGHLPETFPANPARESPTADRADAQRRSSPATAPISTTPKASTSATAATTRTTRPLFPFGYGLSYTTFAYSNLQVHPSLHGATANVSITNTGSITGPEVAQLYLTDPAAAGKPPYQLKGFQKVTLAPGRSQRVTFQLTAQDMSYYKTATSSWAVAPGIYRVSIGSNERDLPVSAPFFSF